MGFFKNATEMLAHLEKQLTCRYRPPAGALFSAALLSVDAARPELLAAQVLVVDEPVEARGNNSYPNLILVEEYVPTMQSVLARLRSLFGDGDKVSGAMVRESFGSVHYEASVNSFRSATHWREETWSITVDDHERGSLAIPSGPVAAVNLPPYLGVGNAVDEFVFGRAMRTGDHSIGMRSVHVVLPDTRARFAAARWAEGRVFLEVELGCDSSEVQLQALFDGGSTRDAATVLAQGTAELDVPSGTNAIFLYLVHRDGDVLAETHLNSVSRKLERSGEVSLEEMAQADIQGGEGDSVEFKPFVSPDHEKVNEIVKTVVAFANTNGGRLYLGIDDLRNPEGRRGLLGAFPPKTAIDGDSKKALSDWLIKVTSDKIKPKAKVQVDFFEYQGEPVARVLVPKGQERPYATGTNEIYIRKGANCVRPDPTTELRQIMSEPGLVTDAFSFDSVDEP